MHCTCTCTHVHVLLSSFAFLLSLSPPFYSFPLLTFLPASFPSYLQAVTNFVTYKFGHLAESERRVALVLAELFLYCFNHWKLETPSVHTRSSPTDNHKSYRENFARCVSMCWSWNDMEIGGSILPPSSILLSLIPSLSLTLPPYSL